MRRDQLVIPDPCHEDWDAMHGPQERRFCDSCEKHVHNLSEMTRREAERLMTAPREGRICVRFRHDRAGRLLFRERRVTPTAPTPQRRGVARLLAGAAMVTSMLVAPLSASAEEADVERRVLEQEKRAAEQLIAYGLDLEEETFIEEVAEVSEEPVEVEMGEAPEVEMMGDVAAPEPHHPTSTDGDGDGGDGDGADGGDGDGADGSEPPPPEHIEMMGEPNIEGEVLMGAPMPIEEPDNTL